MRLAALLRVCDGNFDDVSAENRREPRRPVERIEALMQSPAPLASFFVHAAAAPEAAARAAAVERVPSGDILCADVPVSPA